MSIQLEVLFTPAEIAALSPAKLREATCVVIDALRATSTIVTALANGARAILPLSDVGEALALRAQRPGVLLGGERNGRRIRADVTGGIDFDLGNSPREYTPERVAGKVIVSTTTNGTRALRACVGARNVLVAAFLNLAATAEQLERLRPQRVLIVCSGTQEGAAWEDTLAAGALCDLAQDLFPAAALDDSVHCARQLYRDAQGDLLASMRFSRNARHLLAIPELRDDVPFCLRRDVFPLAAGLLDREAVGRIDAHENWNSAGSVTG